MMKTSLRVLVFVPLLMVASCINETSDNPIDPPPGATVDASPFLGNWRLASVGTYAPTNQLVVRVTTGQVGSVVATFITSTGSNDHSVILCATNGMTIASVQRAANTWEIYAVSTNGSGTTLNLSVPDFAVISNDVASGVMNGQVLSSGEGDYYVHLKATSSQLLAYFSTRTNIFTQAMILQRQ